MKYLFFLIYDFIFFLGLIIYLPLCIYRKKISFPAFKEKLGILDGSKIASETIWIQVVSVGEVNLIEKLVKRLREIHTCRIVITTTTLTGNRLAKKKYASSAEVFFFPFDLSFAVKKALSIFKPRVFIAVETELWPNLLYRLKGNNIPVAVINGRISDKAFKRYKMVRPFMRRLLKKCSYIGVQNQAYKDKYIYLGARSDRITISGNMKFESLSIDENHLQDLRLKYANFLKKENYCLLIGGSTHHPEEEILLKSYKKILTSGKNVKLLLAPRHPQRIPSIERIAKDYGLNPIKISNINNYVNGINDVFLLDTIGELFYLYSFADICFVGGSLTDYGGHNILEPIFFLKPTIFGANMANFSDIRDIVLSKKAAIEIKNEEMLNITLTKLINDSSLRKDISLKCVDVFEEERKSLDENLKIILRCLK